MCIEGWVVDHLAVGGEAYVGGFRVVFLFALQRHGHDLYRLRCISQGLFAILGLRLTVVKVVRVRNAVDLGRPIDPRGIYFRPALGQLFQHDCGAAHLPKLADLFAVGDLMGDFN